MLTALASTYLGERGHEGWGPAQGTQWPVLAGGRAVPLPSAVRGSSPAPGPRYSLGHQVTTGGILPVISDALVVIEERGHLFLDVFLRARGSQGPVTLAAAPTPLWGQSWHLTRGTEGWQHSPTCPQTARCGRTSAGSTSGS